MSAMFLAMVWHARRRQAAMRQVEAVAETRASLLERQERFLHDASHELRTPVTIARGHLELLRREVPNAPEVAVALDELERIEHIVERLLLLAKADQPDFVVLGDVEIESFLEDVFMRWSEVAPRAWRLEIDVSGVVRADAEALRSALDALIENAVKYTEPHDAIALRAFAAGGEIVIEVADERLRRAARAARPDLRPLRPRGRRAHARAGRRRSRPLDRRRDREGARRPLHRRAGRARRDVRAAPAGAAARGAGSRLRRRSRSATRRPGSRRPSYAASSAARSDAT